MELLDCVCENVAQYGQGDVCWCGIYSGSSVPLEHCVVCDSDTCGMAWVRPGAAAPYQTFPATQVDATCAWPILHAVEVGIARCMPTMNDDGSFPDAVSVSDASLGLVFDQFALHRAIRCCKTDTVDSVAIQGWTPVGPAGGCHAGFWTILVDPING